MKNRLLVLASSSPYRAQLLARLGLRFEAVAPHIDESSLQDESPRATAERLAAAKAAALAERFPDALVIGSDQVAVLEGEIMGKPGTHANAVRQLTQASGKEMVFYTALCLLDTRSNARQLATAVNRVKFRPLDPQQIDSYLQRERPYDCAGSAKSEALGIALIEYIRGDDPNALIGLPLIELTTMLRNQGVAVL